MARLTKLDPFYRGDTPLIAVPVTVNGEPADLTGYTAYITFTLNSNPSSNTDAFLHKTMTTDTVNSRFTYQMTNADTEGFDPEQTYYWDVQINKSPANTNNFTIISGTFKPKTDYSRGLA